ncbi:spermidine synthase [Virgisporangium aurantiacum]|uniref:spermine/spermidine synthase domain-containing protein n=1 Tax=Virgisporangium aurantiacum TaxID=175570 RepID=UPI001EF3B698|nr:spermidine synthase [Virgisporangium aurantiacum]
MDPRDETLTIDRAVTERGEIVLRRRGDDFEIISNGVFLMDTRNGESERLLVTAALDACRSPDHVLIGGLGVGFSLAEAVRSASPKIITVVEIEPTVIAWHRDHLGAGGLADPRVRVVRADLMAHLADRADEYDVICLDVDNGPEWTVTDDNRALYGDHGLSLLRSRLRPGGVLAVWSAAESAAFAARLAAMFGRVTTIRVPVPRGAPDVVWVAALEVQ